MKKLVVGGGILICMYLSYPEGEGRPRDSPFPSGKSLHLPTIFSGSLFGLFDCAAWGSFPVWGFCTVLHFSSSCSLSLVRHESWRIYFTFRPLMPRFCRS